MDQYNSHLTGLGPHIAGIRLQIVDPFIPLIMLYRIADSARTDIKKSLIGDLGGRFDEIFKAGGWGPDSSDWDPEVAFLGMTEVIVRIVHKRYDDPIWGVRDVLRRMISEPEDSIMSLHIVVATAAAAEIFEGRIPDSNIPPLDITLDKIEGMYLGSK